MAKRVLDFSGSVNLREMGGYQTRSGQHLRWHKLLRSGDLSNLDQKGQEQLIAYGLKYDLDFRSDSEVKNFPDPSLKGVKYDHLPVYGNSPETPTLHWRRVKGRLKHKEKFQMASNIGGIYQNVILNYHSQQAYGSMFHYLLINDQQDQSVLFHCSAGQDRTGIGAALIEKLFDLPNETITADYLLSNMVYSSRQTQVITDDEVDDYINQMNLSDVQAYNINAIFDAIDYFYGDYEHFTREALKLSNQDIADLKKIYLD